MTTTPEGDMRRLVANGALGAVDRGEDDAALAGLVAVVEQVSGHGRSVLPRARVDIGWPH